MYASSMIGFSIVGYEKRRKQLIVMKDCSGTDHTSANYGGVYAVPWSFLIGVSGEIIKVYPGAILKSYDPAMFQDLVYNIESQLKINN